VSSICRADTCVWRLVRQQGSSNFESSRKSGIGEEEETKVVLSHYNGNVDRGEHLHPQILYLTMVCLPLCLQEMRAHAREVTWFVMQLFYGDKDPAWKFSTFYDYNDHNDRHEVDPQYAQDYITRYMQPVLYPPTIVSSLPIHCI
jgi:hypothetical protein